MFGRGALIVAAGFSMVVGSYSLKMNRMAVQTSDSFNSIWQKALVREEAMNGMNYGINRVWTGHDDYQSITLLAPPCTTQISIYPAGDSVLVRSIARTLVFNDQYWETNRKLQPIVDSVFAWFCNTTPISRWVCYTNQDNGIDWTTGDSAWGPVHCNHNLRTNGSPIFYGKVTAKLGISPNPCGNGNQAGFSGGWEIGIDAPLPTNLNYFRAHAIVSNDNADFNTKCLYTVVTCFEFLADGRVVRNRTTFPIDTVQLTTIAPNGLIYNTMDVKVSGILNGRLTILSDGTIWIMNDLVYAVNPFEDESSDDMLGLIALQNVIVTDNEANNSDVNFHGSIYAITGSFIAENYATRPLAGTLRVVGSIAQAGKGQVSVVSAWDNSVIHGYNKSFYYDPRLKSIAPPDYPCVEKPRLVSWWE